MRMRCLVNARRSFGLGAAKSTKNPVDSGQAEFSPAISIALKMDNCDGKMRRKVTVRITSSDGSGAD